MSTAEYSPGLEGVVAGQTTICTITEEGLTYRGYGIQDPDPFVTRVSGSQRNVVGLPMTLTIQLLSEAGIAPPGKMMT